MFNDKSLINYGTIYVWNILYSLKYAYKESIRKYCVMLFQTLEYKHIKSKIQIL